MEKDNETKFGTCPWCGKHNQVLYFAIGQYDNRIWCGWICNNCLEVKRKEQWGELQ